MKLDIDFHKIDLPVELMQICGASAACVYAVLHAESNENGICDLSKNEISCITGIGTKSLQRIILKLEALGIVERHYNPGYATSYYVKDILSAEVPAERVDPARQSDQQPEELKPGYKFYGEYGWIAMTDKEYDSLVKEYSKSKVDATIDIIDNNIEARKMYHPGIRHGDFGKAYIKEWIEKDIRKAAPNDVIKQQELREIGKYTEERQTEIDKYLDLIN